MKGMSHGEVHSVLSNLEVSPSKSQGSSPIYHGRHGKSGASGKESGFHGGHNKGGKKAKSKGYGSGKYS